MMCNLICKVVLVALVETQLTFAKFIKLVVEQKMLARYGQGYFRKYLRENYYL